MEGGGREIMRRLKGKEKMKKERRWCGRGEGEEQEEERQETEGRRREEGDSRVKREGFDGRDLLREGREERS